MIRNILFLCDGLTNNWNVLFRYKRTNTKIYSANFSSTWMTKELFISCSIHILPWNHIHIRNIHGLLQTVVISELCAQTVSTLIRVMALLTIGVAGLPTLFRKFYSYMASETTIRRILSGNPTIPKFAEANSCSTVMY